MPKITLTDDVMLSKLINGLVPKYMNLDVTVTITYTQRPHDDLLGEIPQYFLKIMNNETGSTDYWQFKTFAKLKEFLEKKKYPAITDPKWIWRKKNGG